MMLWLVNAQGKKCQVRKECLNSEVYPNIRIPILIYESCHVFLLAHIYTPKLRLMSRFRLRVSISYIKHLSPIYPRSSSRSWKFHQISYHRYYSSDQRGCPQNAFHSSPSPSLDGSPSRRNTKSTAWNQLPHRLCNQHCGIRSRFGGGVNLLQTSITKLHPSSTQFKRVTPTALWFRRRMILQVRGK